MAAEGIGTWYYFSPSATGDLIFTISPTSPANYDFSLWGPYISAQCPTGNPIRCSTKNTTSSTGLNTSALDQWDTGDGWASKLVIAAAQVNKVYVLYVKKTSAGTGQDFTLSFPSPSPALYCGILPIELIDLQAQARERVVDVTWATATEQNSDHYDIQRSFDGADYSTIGTLPAAGDAQYRTDYAFTDNTPGPGANYYHLKEVDRDGAITITRTVVALMEGATQVPVIFPNPVTGTLNVSFTAFRDGIAVLSVRDALGRIVKEQSSAVQRGEQTVRFPMDDLQRGCYSLQVALPSGIVARGGTFVKQ